MREPRLSPEYVRGQRPGDVYVRLLRPRRAAAQTEAPPPRFWPLALWTRWTRAAHKGG